MTTALEDDDGVDDDDARRREDLKMCFFGHGCHKKNRCSTCEQVLVYLVVKLRFRNYPRFRNSYSETQIQKLDETSD